MHRKSSKNCLYHFASFLLRVDQFLFFHLHIFPFGPLDKLRPLPKQNANKYHMQGTRLNLSAW